MDFLRTKAALGRRKAAASGSGHPLLGRAAFLPFCSNLVIHTLTGPPQAAAALAMCPPLRCPILSPSGGRAERGGGKAPHTRGRAGAPPTPSPPVGRLTGTGMQGLGSHDERGAHGVEGKFLKVVARLLGEDLVDHESLVAPPGCFELAGRGEPQLRVAVHGEPGAREAGAPAGSVPGGASAAGRRRKAWRGAEGSGHRARRPRV